MGGRRDEKICGPESVDWFCFDASGRSHAGQSRCGVFVRTQSHLLKTSDPHIVWRMDPFIDVVLVHTYKLVVAHLPQRHPPPLFPRFCLKLLQIRPDKFQIIYNIALALGPSMLEHFYHTVLLWKRDIGLVSKHVTGWNLDIILTPPVIALAQLFHDIGFPIKPQSQLDSGWSSSNQD